MELSNFRWSVGAVFSISGTPTQIAVSSTATTFLPIEFTPTAVTNYTDTLVYTVTENGCTIEDTLIVNGTGIPGGTSFIWIPDTLVSPSLTDFRLPVYGIVPDVSELAVNENQLTLQVQWNLRLFTPFSVSRGTIIDTAINGDIGTFTIVIDDAPLSADTTLLTEIVGATLLGNVKMTDVTILDAQWQGGSPVVDEPDLGSGSLSIEICIEGGDRLLQVNPTFRVQAYPNPVTSYVTVEIESADVGKYELLLVSARGNVTRLKSWYKSLNENSLHESTIPMNTIAQGQYSLVLITPRKQTMTTLVVRR
jgi:hypothetical protein